MKNEKCLLDIQTKCGAIASEVLNAAIDAERTFKCKWPNKKYKVRQKNQFHLDHFDNFQKNQFKIEKKHYPVLALIRIPCQPFQR